MNDKFWRRLRNLFLFMQSRDTKPLCLVLVEGLMMLALQKYFPDQFIVLIDRKNLICSFTLELSKIFLGGLNK